MDWPYDKKIIYGGAGCQLHLYPIEELLNNWEPKMDTMDYSSMFRPLGDPTQRLTPGQWYEVGKRLSKEIAEKEASMILNGAVDVKTVMNLHLIIQYDTKAKVAVDSLVDQIALAAMVAVGRHDKKSRVTVRAYDTRLETVPPEKEVDSPMLMRLRLENAALKADVEQARAALKEANDGFARATNERDHYSGRLVSVQKELDDLKYQLAELSE